MHTAYNILLFLSVLIAIVFSVLVLITGKGDAMSGGGSVRTSFKGKASFDDYMSRLTLILGTSFFVLMLLIDGVSNRIDVANESSILPKAATVQTSVPVKTTVPVQTTTPVQTAPPAQTSPATPTPAPAKPNH